MTIRPLERTYDNAPDFVQRAGGTVMSLWLFGALTTDLQKIAQALEDRDRYRQCLETIARQESGVFGVWANQALLHPGEGGR